MTEIIDNFAEEVDAAIEEKLVQDEGCVVAHAERSEVSENAEIAENVDVIVNAEAEEKIEAAENAVVEEKVEAAENAVVAEKVEAAENTEAEEKIEAAEDAEAEEKVEAAEDAEAEEKIEAAENTEAEEKIEALENAVVAENPENVEVADTTENNPSRKAPDVIAVVGGTVITELPQDLYVPPEALEVFLETFEGPLDLLLYLIKKQNVDILDIPVAKITHQYMKYVDLMKSVKLELAADYLVMAAMLAEIKSRMILPRPAHADEEEDDPRAELVRRLQEYERFKRAAQDIDEMPRMGRDFFDVNIVYDKVAAKKGPPPLELEELLAAFRQVLLRVDLNTSHAIQRETISVREKMAYVLDSIRSETEFVEFKQLFNYEEGRMGIVVTFLAILELVKESLLDIVQAKAFGPIHLKVVNADDEA